MEALDEIAIGITPHAVTILNARRNKILRHIHPPEVRYIVHTDTEEGESQLHGQQEMYYSIQFPTSRRRRPRPPLPFSLL